METAKRQIYLKQLSRYKYVCFILGIAVIFAFWSKIPAVQIQCDLSPDICSDINNSVFSISISYVVGFIIFLLTVFIPDAERKFDDDERIAYYLNKLRKDYQSLINFSDKAENFQRPTFAELSNTLFQEDVSEYCKELTLSDKKEECELCVHFKPEKLLELELNANIIREDINLLQMMSPRLSYPIIDILSKLSRSRLIKEIESRRGFRDKFSEHELEMRLILYKFMMQDYREVEGELLNVVDENNKYFPQYQDGKCPRGETR